MKKPWIIHPFLFAIYPPLFLYSKNVDQIPISCVFRAIIALTVAALLLFILFGGILKSRTKAGLLITCFLIWLFCYQNFFEVMKVAAFAGVVIGRQKYVFSLWTVCFLLFGIYFAKSSRNFYNLTKIVNFTSLVLVAFCLVGACAYKVVGKNPTVSSFHNLKENALNLECEESAAGKLEDATELPDIYYIILDSYARDDALKRYYGFDNREFHDYLIGKGFFVADRSLSNYDFTFFSLPSSLNMEYLPDVTADFGIGLDELLSRGLAIKNSKVMRFLRTKGYKYIAIGFENEFADMNRFYKGGNEFAEYSFKDALLRKTFIGRLAGVMSLIGSNSGRRESVLFDFDELTQVTKVGGPKFVFAHILAPHSPYLFGPNGEKNTLKSIKFGIRQLYTRQVQYVNKRTSEVIDAILSQSERPPIIILQADHGSRFDSGSRSLLDPETFNDKLAILNAYYLPDNQTDILYRSISPVNTFRVLFNHYFNTNYELLKDESYLTIGDNRIVKVTDKIIHE